MSVALVLLICSLAACGGSTAHRPKATPSPTATPAPKGWSTIPSPGVGQEGDLRAVTALSATDGWAVGQYEGLDSLQRTLTERWNGSQWVYQPSPSPGQEDNMLQAVSGSSSSDVWAAGYQSSSGNIDQPLIEHWDGNSWSVVSSPVPNHATATLSGISAISPTDAWAVGTFNNPLNGSETPLIEHWNGSAWSIVNGATLPPSTSGGLAAVTALSSNNVWAVGSILGGNVQMPSLIEHWNGQRWALVTGARPSNQYDTDNALSSISAVSPDDIWAAGTGAPLPAEGCGVGNGVVIEHWNGTAWSSVPFTLPPASQGNLSFAGIAAASANDVWVVGGLNVYSATGATVTPIVEHWNGTKWSLVSNPISSTSHGLSGVAAGHGGPMFTVGQYEAANGPSMTLAEQASATTLSLVTSASPGTLFNSLQAVTSIAASDVWAVGSSAAGNLAEHWDGNSWAVSAVPNGSPANDSLNGVAGSSTSDVWAVGSANNTASIVHWNGSQWAAVASVPESQYSSLSGVVALSSSNAWAVGSASGPLVEHWDGAKWSAVATPTTAPGTDLTEEAFLAVTAASPSDIWAVGGDEIHSCGGTLPALIEHWNGSSWSVIPNLPQGILYGVTEVSASDVWAVGWAGSGILVMHWNGKQWSTISTPTPAAHSYPVLQSVAAHGADDVWAVGYSNNYPAGLQVLALHWDGHAWSAVQVPTPGVVNNAFYGITTVADGELWAVGQYDDGGSGGAHQALIEHYNP